jgi:PAS domain S-box-containing protein
MFKLKSFNIILTCCLLILCSVLLQWFNPSLWFPDWGYIAAILLTIFLKFDGYSKMFGAISLVLILLSYFYHNGGTKIHEVIPLRLFSLMTVIMIVLFVLYVKRQFRSIELEKQQMNALFEHATEGIILTNDKGTIIQLNPASLSLFGYEKEELLGKPIEQLIPHRFQEGHVKHREGFNRQPSNRTMGQGRDLFAKKKDNTEFPVEVSLSFYKQESNFFVIAFVVDITPRKQSERELLDQKTKLGMISDAVIKLNAELEQKVDQRTLILRDALSELEESQEELSQALSKEKELGEIKSRFVSMASHEFRTPLSTVLSSAALLSKYTNTEDQEKRDKHIRRIKDSVKHLNDLLEDFLSLGKLEEGKITTELSVIPVKETLEEVVDEMRSLAKQGQQILFVFTGPNEFTSDKHLLRNITINLLTNALKFSPEMALVNLDVSHFPEKGLVLIVKDQGIGISQEDQQHLFSSFFRGTNVTNIEGTGLGLHIVKKYVDLLKGTIHLESIIEQGTRITVELPLPGKM